MDDQSNAHVRALQEAQDSALMSPTLGLGLLRANSAVSSGNLTFRKRLWQAVGGFRDYRYNHDWDFCLRAALHAEPVLVPHVLYEYRVHARNTITESSGAPRAEQRVVMAAFIADAHGRADWQNPLAPVLQRWSGEVLALLGATDSLRHVPLETIAAALRGPGDRA